MMVISEVENQIRVIKTCKMCGGSIRKFNSDRRLRSLKAAWLHQKYCSRECTNKNKNIFKAMRTFFIMVDNILIRNNKVDKINNRIIKPVKSNINQDSKKYKPSKKYSHDIRDDIIKNKLQWELVSTPRSYPYYSDELLHIADNHPYYSNNQIIEPLIHMC